MATFKRKTISQGQTIGDRLKKARQEKNLTLADVSKETKIQQRYLEYLEIGDYQKIPGDVYIRMWLKIYAQVLGLPAQEILRDYKLEKQIGKKAFAQPSKQEFKFDWRNLLKPKFLRWTAIAVFVVIFLGYLGWEVNNIISPPEINILAPANNFRTTESSITIVGQTEAEVQLKINNEIILLDDQGNFRQPVNLSVGLNNLQISAKKKYSRTNNLDLVVLREATE